MIAGTTEKSKMAGTYKTNQFQEFEHAADLGLEIWADELNMLFRNAADGMYSLIFIEKPGAGDAVEDNFSIEAFSLEDLLVQFLSELNFLLLVKKKYFRNISKLDISHSDNGFTLTCQGQTIRLAESCFDDIFEIKSVTYHQLKIIKKDQQFYTRIVFDI